jgi:hypothetical protein
VKTFAPGPPAARVRLTRFDRAAARRGAHFRGLVLGAGFTLEEHSHDLDVRAYGGEFRLACDPTQGTFAIACSDTFDRWFNSIDFVALIPRDAAALAAVLDAARAHLRAGEVDRGYGQKLRLSPAEAW